MIVAASALARHVALSTLVYAVRGCLGALIVRNGLRILGGIRRLSVAADASISERGLVM